MKKRLLIILLFLFLYPVNVSAKVYPPLDLLWEWPIITNDFYYLDLNKDGLYDFYLITYNKNDHKGYIHVLNESGHLIDKTWVEGFLGQSDFKRPETIEFMWLGDLDNDKNLDIIASSQIRGGQVNFRIIYGFERQIDPGHPLRPVRKWFYDDAFLLTHGEGRDIDYDGEKEFIGSSVDGKIYVFNNEGKLKENFELSGAVWDFSIVNIDNGTDFEIAAGYSSGLTLIKDSAPLWDIKTKKRVFKVKIANVDNTKYPEIIAATEDEVFVYNISGSKIFSKTFPSDKIKGFVMLDVDNDTKKEIVLLSGNEVYAIDVDNDYGFGRKTNEGGVKWKFTFWAYSNDIFTAGNETLIIAGEKTYAFSISHNSINNEIALRYLETAKDYYKRKECEKALAWADKAKKIFASIENNEALIEVTNIITLCSPTEEEEAEINQAKKYYVLGNSSYDEGDLRKARTYLREALDIYLKWGYRKDALETDSLIQTINKELRKEGEIKGKELYVKALEFREEEDYENALFYAKGALKIYVEIEDEKNIKLLQAVVNELESKGNLLSGDSNYKKSLKSMKEKNYENASNYATIAKSFYLNLNESFQEKNEKVKLANDLIIKAKKYEKAEDYYKKASTYFKSKIYKNATLYAEGAREIFLELEDTDGIDKTNELLSDIKKKTGAFDIYILGGSLIFGFILIVLIIFIFLKKKREEERHY